MDVGKTTDVHPSNDVAETTDYVFQLGMFEGPLDLLYHMVREKEIDIWDIPIADLTDQYLAYIDGLRELSIEPAAEFLVMAARLIQIKVQMLLPPPITDDEDDEDDPRLGLAIDLYQYVLFKEAAEDLGALGEKRQYLFGRPESARPALSGVSYPDPAGGATLQLLAEAFLRIVTAARETTPVPIPKMRVSVSEKVEHVRRLFLMEDQLLFERLFEGQVSRPVIVATFLAVLELVREGTLSFHQEDPSGHIVITRRSYQS